MSAMAHAYNSMPYVHNSPEPVGAGLPASRSKSHRGLKLVPSCERNTHMEKKPVSYTQLPKELGIKDRLKTALQRRLCPAGNLRAKELAYATQLSASTIDNILSANHEPAARTISKLGSFFGAAFLAEVFDAPGLLDLTGRRVAAAIRKIEEGKRELEAALGTGTGE